MIEKFQRGNEVVIRCEIEGETAEAVVVGSDVADIDADKIAETHDLQETAKQS